MSAPQARGRAMSRLWAKDAELAKKDDDHHLPKQQGHKQAQWQASRLPRRRMFARVIAYALITFLIIYSFVRFFSASDATPGNRQPSAGRYTPDDVYDILPNRAPRPKPAPAAKDKGDKGEGALTYSGPVKFPELATSLYGISSMGGKQQKNRNVLFAAASLKSTAAMLPMACQMGREGQNFVHFAFMGRNTIALKELARINGIDEDCKIILHDARTDHTDTSTEARMMVASLRALHHINAFMHPQAVFIDSTDAEENYFVLGARDQLGAMASALIELPENPGVRLSWVTKLDAASLAVWDKVELDILIQVPKNGAGNLKRLLQSLSKADLTAMAIPHITIDLPPYVDREVEVVLADFEWPTVYLSSGNPVQMVSLRRRISRQKLTEEESSVRFLESFWPKSGMFSHVLVLAPHTELHPQFFHYLKYTLLHHRFSDAAISQRWDKKLMSIGFSSPNTLLDMSQPLTVPEAASQKKADGAFLWQGPSSDATLFAGAKWVELHWFISRLLEHQHSLTDSAAILAQKEISKKHPAWLEYVLQLSRLRGYYTIYPSRETAEVILGTHDDLPDVPEEYSDDAEARKDAMGNGIKDKATNSFDADSKVSMLSTLPREGILPSLEDLPLIGWDGKPLQLESLTQEAVAYSAKFRREVGQCSEDEASKSPDRYARDLFCVSQ